MLLSTLFNLIPVTNCQGANFGAAIIDKCLFIGWHRSFLNLSEATPSREQNKDYSSNQGLSRKNAELKPKPNRGRYKTNLVVLR